MAASTRREALFSELQALIAPTRGKPDPHENLTDVLEIMPVGEGLKPAHVQGQGMRDSARLESVEAIATRHGLRALRTQPVLAFFHRPPNIPQMVLDGQRADERARLNAEPPVDASMESNEYRIASTMLRLTGMFGQFGARGFSAAARKAKPRYATWRLELVNDVAWMRPAARVGFAIVIQS